MRSFTRPVIFLGFLSDIFQVARSSPSSSLSNCYSFGSTRIRTPFALYTIILPKLYFRKTFMRCASFAVTSIRKCFSAMFGVNVSGIRVWIGWCYVWCLLISDRRRDVGIDKCKRERISYIRTIYTLFQHFLFTHNLYFS